MKPYQNLKVSPIADSLKYIQWSHQFFCFKTYFNFKTILQVLDHQDTILCRTKDQAGHIHGTTYSILC